MCYWYLKQNKKTKLFELCFILDKTTATTKKEKLPKMKMKKKKHNLSKYDMNIYLRLYKKMKRKRKKNNRKRVIYISKGEKVNQILHFNLVDYFLLF